MIRTPLLYPARIALAATLVFVAIIKLRAGATAPSSLPTWAYWSSIGVEWAIAIGLLTSSFAWAARLLIAFAGIAVLHWYVSPTDTGSTCGCLGGLERSAPKLPAIVAACWGLGALAVLWLREPLTSMPLENAAHGES